MTFPLPQPEPPEDSLPSRRPPYDETFKRETLNLWKSSGRPAREIARQVGVSPASLYAWAREAHGALPGGGPLADSKHIQDLETELARLRLENERLKQQREILKKTLGILSEPLRPQGFPA